MKDKAEVNAPGICCVVSWAMLCNTSDTEVVSNMTYFKAITRKKCEIHVHTESGINEGHCARN